MSMLQRLVQRVTGGVPPPDSSLAEARTKTHRKILQTVAFALEVRDAELEIMEHCALVSILCGSLGRLADLNEADAHVLETAAELHEVAMFTIPRSLLMGTSPLSQEELQLIRGQAKISAEIAATTHPPRVARLIEHQYDDYEALADRLPERDLLLAGILRVSDVIVAVTHPRPYQPPLRSADRSQMLTGGSGTRFHPLVVASALRLGGVA